MKLADDVISRKADQGDFFGGGASQCKKKKKKSRKKSLKIYEANLYGTLEEFMMFTLIYFNRSQHAFAFHGTFNHITFSIVQSWNGSI